MKTPFTTHRLAETPDAIAPDGSEVRVLARLAGGSMAHFRLPAGAVSRAVVHRTVEELWYFVGGRGRMWRHDGDREEIVEARPGVSISIPVGTALPVPRRRRRGARGGRRHHAAMAGAGGGRAGRGHLAGHGTPVGKRPASHRASGCLRWFLPGGGPWCFAGGERVAGFEQALQAGEDLRPAVETASISLELSRSISCVIVSLTASPWLAMSKVQRLKPSALSSGRNSFRHLMTRRFPGSASTISPVSVMRAVGVHHLPRRAGLPIGFQRDAEPILPRELGLGQGVPQLGGRRADVGHVDELAGHCSFLSRFFFRSLNAPRRPISYLPIHRSAISLMGTGLR